MASTGEEANERTKKKTTKKIGFKKRCSASNSPFGATATKRKMEKKNRTLSEDFFAAAAEQME